MSLCGESAGHSGASYDVCNGPPDFYYRLRPLYVVCLVKFYLRWESPVSKTNSNRITVNNEDIVSGGKFQVIFYKSSTMGKVV